MYGVFLFPAKVRGHFASMTAMIRDKTENIRIPSIPEIAFFLLLPFIRFDARGLRASNSCTRVICATSVICYLFNERLSIFRAG